MENIMISMFGAYTAKKIMLIKGVPNSVCFSITQRPTKTSVKVIIHACKYRQVGQLHASKEKLCGFCLTF